MKRVKKPVEQHDLHVKTGDKVVVISGKDKGKVGNVKKIVTSENKVIVEGANMITKATKPNPMAGVQGGLIKMEAAMDSSKVMLYCPSCEKATRVKFEVKGDKKVRICKKCGEQLDV
ncbi:MAG: 50S ribosomal protein L24 [Candidatus Gastranaerophilales bacterium]|nr:50S ribosomal protein L24 [Candidatus Gastranaerophilales bacterium]